MYGQFDNNLGDLGFAAPRSLKRAVKRAAPKRAAPRGGFVGPRRAAPKPAAPSVPGGGMRPGAGYGQPGAYAGGAHPVVAETSLPFVQERFTHEQLRRLRQEAKYGREVTDRYNFEDGDGYEPELESEAITETARQKAVEDSAGGPGLPTNGAAIKVKPETPDALPLIGLGALAWLLFM